MLRPHPADATYDAVIIGSGFGSLFWLHGFLRRRPAARVLVLERGRVHDHAWQLQAGRNSAIAAGDTFRVPSGHKPWNFTVAWGGGLNCWWAQTPRWHPSDFETASRYGVGVDWPFGYDELEPWYTEAERLMDVAGDDAIARIAPRSAPFPQPPHRLTSVDRLMQAAQPDAHFALPTARARRATSTRNACCSSARCHLCPVDAKFTAQNGFAGLLADARVDVVVDADVRSLTWQGGTVAATTYVRDGRDVTARGDLFVLGANAIHSPAILLRSGAAGEHTGAGIHEQVGFDAEALLDGLDHFDGGTVTTAANYGLYDGPFRRDRAGALVYFENRWKHGLRTEHGRWRQTLPLTVVVEDLPRAENRVTVDAAGNVVVSHAAPSDWALRGVAAAWDGLAALLAPLPVEALRRVQDRPTESHVQGTLRMGQDRASSVVDADLVHHDLRNLVVVGSAVFPSCSCANPSLTVAALSLRAAARLAA